MTAFPPNGGRPTPARKTSRGRFRQVMKGLIIGWNVLMLILLIVSLNVSSGCQDLTGDDLTACQAGEGFGKSAVIVMLLVVWLLVDLLLLVLFLVAKRRGEEVY
jgi:hypothetical protein